MDQHKKEPTHISEIINNLAERQSITEKSINNKWLRHKLWPKSQFVQIWMNCKRVFWHSKTALRWKRTQIHMLWRSWKRQKSCQRNNYSQRISEKETYNIQFSKQFQLTSKTMRFCWNIWVQWDAPLLTTVYYIFYFIFDCHGSKDQTYCTFTHLS